MTSYLIFSKIFSRNVKLHCAEPFTQYWTCIDYTNLLELRKCRKQQAAFDDCVLEKLGWVRPDLGQLSKVISLLRNPIRAFARLSLLVVATAFMKSKKS